MKKLSKFVVKKSPIFLAIFLLVLGPAVYGYNNTNIYYDMAGGAAKGYELCHIQQQADGSV